MKYFKLIVMATSICGMVGLALLVDQFYGKGAGIIVFHTFGWALFFIIATPISIFLLLPVLKVVLGKAPESLTAEERIEIWMTIAEIFSFEDPSREEVASIARRLRDLRVDKKLTKKILETEVGPVCQGYMIRAGDDYLEGIDNWNREWLTNQILAGTKAYKFIRAIPLVGFCWSSMITMGRQESIDILYDELEFNSEAEQKH